MTPALPRRVGLAAAPLVVEVCTPEGGSLLAPDDEAVAAGAGSSEGGRGGTRPAQQGAVPLPARTSLAGYSQLGAVSIANLAAIALGTMAFTMQDVLLEPYGGQVLGMSVAENVSLSSLDRATRFGLVSRRLERERATAAVARLEGWWRGWRRGWRGFHF